MGAWHAKCPDKTPIRMDIRDRPHSYTPKSSAAWYPYITQHALIFVALDPRVRLHAMRILRMRLDYLDLLLWILARRGIEPHVIRDSPIQGLDLQKLEHFRA